jgi:PAS domain S-box-containing protein
MAPLVLAPLLQGSPMSIYAWSSVSLSALIVAVACLARNVVQRRDEHRRELTARRLLEVMVDNASEAMIHESLAGTILGWNLAAERMFGVPAPAALGRRLASIIPPERISGEDVILASLAAGIRLRDFETHIAREDGTRFLASVTVAPIRNDAGESVGALRTIRDISDRMRFGAGLQGIE